jgi:6-pyruvoyltetrahydropterin/6-carboxytetrahydropterin synthase
LEVTVGGAVDATTGMVCNLADLDSFVNEKILERFGHEDLNHLAEFAGVVPTTENLCIVLYKILEEGFRRAHVERIRMEETMLNSFEYAGGREIHD